MSDLKLGEVLPIGSGQQHREIQDAAAVVRPHERSIASMTAAYSDNPLFDQLLLFPMKFGLSMALASDFVLNHMSAEQAGVLERSDVQQVAQRLYAKGRKKVRCRHLGVWRAGRRAAWPELSRRTKNGSDAAGRRPPSPIHMVGLAAPRSSISRSMLQSFPTTRARVSMMTGSAEARGGGAPPLPPIYHESGVISSTVRK